MAQPLITGMDVNGVNSPDTKENHNQNHHTNETASQQSQPTIRHIPIFVEGRDEPLINKNLENIPDIGINCKPSPSNNDIPKTSSIFSRVKDIPVRKNISDFQSNIARSASPARSIPINVQTYTSQNNGHEIPNNSQHHPTVQQSQKQPVNNLQQQESLQQQRATSVERQSTPKPTTQPESAISKIQKIQNEILLLMDKVENFNGSRKDKDYMYLDEMLTQNLLKLDTIDTDGKDNIKAARKEVINCINKCISVLEAKADMNPKINNKSSENVPNNISNDKNSIKTP